MVSVFKKCVLPLHLPFLIFTPIILEHFPKCIVNMHPFIGLYTFTHSDKSHHKIQKQYMYFKRAEIKIAVKQ